MTVFWGCSQKDGGFFGSCAHWRLLCSMLGGHHSLSQFRNLVNVLYT